MDPAIECDDDDGCGAIHEAIGIYAGPNTPLPAAVVRLLADLRCYCRQSGVDFEVALAASQHDLKEKRTAAKIVTVALALCVAM